jgi:hypothetical protein
MKRIVRRILIGIASAVVALPAWAQDLGTLDGTWQGSLGPINGPNLFKMTEPHIVRIVITGSNAKVYKSTKDGAFTEVKPGAFHVVQLQTNAIIYAINSGSDNEGTWVQTWEYAVTLKDRNTLITNWIDVVNNINVPLSVDHSKFTAAASGDLVRSR